MHKEVMQMEIRNKRYKELARAELTLKMIKDFIIRENGEISAEAIVNHVNWLLEVYEEMEENK